MTAEEIYEGNEKYNAVQLSPEQSAAVRAKLAAMEVEHIASLPTQRLEGIHNARRFSREEVDAALAKDMASFTTLRLAPQQLSKDKSASSFQKKDQDFRRKQSEKKPEKNNKDLPSTPGNRIERLVLYATSIAIHDSRQKQTEKDPQQNNETEKTQGTKLETFLKINKDLLSTAGSRIERLFLHAASIAIFAIWLVADKLNQRKKIPVQLKTDGNRANRQNFRTKTQARTANIEANRPLPRQQEEGAGRRNRRLAPGRTR
jgi:hypothetical protein